MEQNVFLKNFLKMSLIYEPAEDSFLVCEAVSKLKNLEDKKILEMGSGSGVIAEALLSNKVQEKNLTLQKSILMNLVEFTKQL